MNVVYHSLNIVKLTLLAICESYCLLAVTGFGCTLIILDSWNSNLGVPIANGILILLGPHHRYHPWNVLCLETA